MRHATPWWLCPQALPDGRSRRPSDRPRQFYLDQAEGCRAAAHAQVDAAAKQALLDMARGWITLSEGRGSQSVH